MPEAVQPLCVTDIQAGHPRPPPQPTQDSCPIPTRCLSFPTTTLGDMHGDRPLSSATAVNGSLFVTHLPSVPPSPPAPSSPLLSYAAFSLPAQSQAFMVPEALVTPRSPAVTTQA